MHAEHNDTAVATAPAPQPPAVEPTEGTHLAGDIVERGIQRNKPEFQDDLRWWYRFGGERSYSDAESARQLGVDPGTYSKVLRGCYVGTTGLVLPPPVKMLSRIRAIRAQEREAAQTRNAGRVKTPTVEEIWQVCDKAHADRLIAFIFGESHVGKSEALMWYRDENNHGRTLYVDLQGATGVQDVWRAFAVALRISPSTGTAKLRQRVIAAIDRSNLVIVDEFHSITQTYQHASSLKMVIAIKEVKDRTGCGMVICSTDVGRSEIESGRDAKFLKQLWRRGVLKLQLPAALRVSDVREFAKAYGLDFPAAPKGVETWKSLRREHPDFAGLGLCERIAYDFGVQHLVTVLRDGTKRALKREQEPSWAHANAAQEIYDGLSAKKET